ncbi:MAG TPA: ribonuclease J [Patescibacteria group bacterium]|nr:ribonuclease J [Patescibacteria group bacterium]
MNNNYLSFLPLGGCGDVTKNMYVYEYDGQILLVDCGIGFADETMLGVELLLPDITYLKNTKSKIVGMLITHGHEDHMGALPFLLPQLPDFPIFATSFTAALANEKLNEFGVNKKVQEVTFEKGQEVKLGVFSASFIRVTHSVPDTAHIVIKTPIGTIYHGSDYKFDLTPYDGKRTDFAQIARIGSDGVLALVTDCLGSERKGYTPSEAGLEKHFADAMRECSGKCLITTYSSNINRIKQAIDAATMLKKRVCFVGRSLINTVEIAKQKGLIQLPKGMEVSLDQIKQVRDKDLLLLVAGSQGQENSSMTRIAEGIHRDVKLSSQDMVIFSADTIPGNEVLVNALIDAITKVGATVLYSDITPDFHVSGHGSEQDMLLLLSLVQPRYVIPTSGTQKHMGAYQQIAKRFGYQNNVIMIGEDGQEITISSSMIRFGKKIPIRTVYLDEISGEKVEEYVLLDRQKLSSEGMIVVIATIDGNTKELLQPVEVIFKGISEDTQEMQRFIVNTLRKTLSMQSTQIKPVVMRKLLSETIEKTLHQQYKRKPLILPIIIDM